ncbi:MAG: GPW/gp25 family protein [Saprospiraceae bacterium]|nr:GPW/gp25 family protein [Saprospiraceae bacterium]
MALDKPFLGTGWSFPPAFSPESETVEMVSGETDINQSIFILLSTSLKERVMQPTYGCNLTDYQFEPANNGFLSFLRDLIAQALLNHEPRIIVENIYITEPDSLDLIEGKVLIEVDYRISETNTRFNFVYDFYRREANRPI